jgi:hypothetical protein
MVALATNFFGLFCTGFGAGKNFGVFFADLELFRAGHG